MELSEIWTKPAAPAKWSRSNTWTTIKLWAVIIGLPAVIAILVVLYRQSQHWPIIVN